MEHFNTIDTSRCFLSWPWRSFSLHPWATRMLWELQSSANNEIIQDFFYFSTSQTCQAEYVLTSKRLPVPTCAWGWWGWSEWHRHWLMISAERQASQQWKYCVVVPQTSPYIPCSCFCEVSTDKWMMGAISLRIKVKHTLMNFTECLTSHERQATFPRKLLTFITHVSGKDQSSDKLIFYSHVSKWWVWLRRV